MKGSIWRVFIIFFSGFILLGCYLTYIQVFQGSELSAHAFNRRNWEMSKTVPRGMILDKNGKAVARSDMTGSEDNGPYVRNYPYGKVFAPVTGFVSDKYGKTGLESTYNQYLSGIDDPQFQLGPISRLWRHSGYNIVLSIDANVQQTAYQALGNHRGAVIVMEPETGRILALVSKPSYDPATVEQSWKAIVEDQDSMLLNRALQGLYPPGSSIKPLIAAAALEEGVTSTQKTYKSPGYLTIGNYTLHEIDDNAFGEINLSKAMAYSSNVAFGQMGLDLGRERVGKYFDKFAFNQEPPLLLPAEISRLPKFSRLADGELAQTAIGQGELLVTPLAMAMMTSALANHGIMMKPLLVTAVTNEQGQIIKSFAPAVWYKPVSQKAADTVKTLMGDVVEWGTGTTVRLRSVRIAGKTGTAENPHGAPHAWFVGLAPIEKPQVIVVVIVENGGSGGSVAGPVARRIFEEVL